MHTILRLKKVTEKTGLAKSTIYKKIAANEFPKQRALTSSAVGWLQCEIDNWINSREFARANDNEIAEKQFKIIPQDEDEEVSPANDNLKT